MNELHNRIVEDRDEYEEIKRKLEINDLISAVHNLGSEFIDLRKQLNSVEALVIDLREVLRSINWETKKCLKGENGYNECKFAIGDIEVLLNTISAILSKI
ncbi:MAG: hypothetical protein J7K36_01265 [Archaeoglobaceae archaeon]|nr:hypothetical protein [Archaeoglobaceae archaeon]